MSYSKMKLQKLQKEFQLQVEREEFSFDYEERKPSSWLLETLERGKKKRLTTEKAKCEFIIAPILSEIEDYYKEHISLFSGEVMNVDSKRGLAGEIDFIFSKGIDYIRVVSPVVAVVEAKKSDINIGIEQCSAQLVGMDLLNKRNHSVYYPLYGCVTNANDWVFMKLEESTITIDTNTYFINQLPSILGIFHSILKATL